jgi:drug/metabolite transporter (DMT)-like permease
MADMKSERKKGILALILLALVFASMGLFVRYLQTDFTLLQQTYLRIGAAFILGYLLFFKDIDLGKLAKVPKKDWVVILLRSVSLYVLAVPLVSQSILTTKYSNASLIGGLPLAALLGFIILKEKATVPKILYLTLAFVGVALIGVKDITNIFVWGRGEILALLANFFFSLSYVLRRLQSDVLNNKEIAVVIFFISTILLLVTSFFFGESVPNPMAWTPILITAIIFAGLFNVANLFLTNYGFQKVEAVLASNLLTLETVFAIMLGFMFYQEVPSLKEFIGGVIIVYSVWQMNKITEK